MTDALDAIRAALPQSVLLLTLLLVVFAGLCAVAEWWDQRTEDEQ